MDKKKILVVDDESDLVEFVSIRLQANGYDVVSAVDGQQALEVVKKEMPDLILLDILLPKLSGHEVCGILKKDSLYSRIPILMLTAKDAPEDILLAKKMGADGYIPKPFDAPVLLFHIHELLK